VPGKLECLAVKGNFIDRHPDYKSLLIQYFPGLKELDSMQVTEAVRAQIRDGLEIKRKLITWIYKFD